MNPNDRPAQPQRILIALDASEDSKRALEAAARLAARLEAELVGLFVEETELIEAAALPVSRLIPSYALGAVALDAALMRRALRITSAQARSSLAATAERWRLRWSFQVSRGSLSEGVRAEARGHDLLALDRSPGARRGSRPAEALSRVAAEATCSVLLLRRGGLARRPVVAVHAGSGRALAVGLALAHAHGRALHVLALGDSEAAARGLAEAAKIYLADNAATGALRWLASRDPGEIRAALRGESPGAVVLDRAGDGMPAIDAETLAEELDCSILDLRG